MVPFDLAIIEFLQYFDIKFTSYEIRLFSFASWYVKTMVSHN